MFDSLLLYSSLMSECAKHGYMVTDLVILYLVDSSEGQLSLLIVVLFMILVFSHDLLIAS